MAARELPAWIAGGGRVGFYWPLPGEVDLRPLTGEPWLPEDRAALPAVLPPGELLYLPWRPGQELRPDSCGIPAPLDGALGTWPAPLDPGELAVLLVPALAITAAGLRLGSGGGWYDRLRSDPRWRAVPALAVLPAVCRVETLPRDPWDVPFDGWIDETGLHRTGGANVARS